MFSVSLVHYKIIHETIKNFETKKSKHDVPLLFFVFAKHSQASLATARIGLLFLQF